MKRQNAKRKENVKIEENFLRKWEKGEEYVKLEMRMKTEKTADKRKQKPVGIFER